MVLDRNFYQSYVVGVVIGTSILASARFMRSPSGHATRAESALICLAIPLRGVGVAAKIGQILRSHTGSPALSNLLTAAETPLFLVMVVFISCYASRD